MYCNILYRSGVFLRGELYFVSKRFCHDNLNYITFFQYLLQQQQVLEKHIPLKFQAKTLIIKSFYCNFSNNCILLFSKMSETFDYVLVCCLFLFSFISCNRWKITLLVVYLWTGFCKELVPVIVLQASFPEFVNCLYKCIISYRIQMSSFSCCMLFCVDVLDKLCVA